MNTPIASIIMAAGRGSRMKGYPGNKTLLPLIAGESLFQGERPILCHIIENLPSGPKALIVNHCKEAVMAATQDLDPTYCLQPALNGTGGAILAAADFIRKQPCERLVITMGDVPFVRKETYRHLVDGLSSSDLMVLGFRPADKKQYGLLEIQAGQVRRITEWKFWKDFPPERQETLTICNSGIYAVKKHTLEHYLPIMAARPHVVHKEINGQSTAIEEFFITDLIEYLVQDGRPVGYRVTENEIETMGVDDSDALEKAQAVYLRRDPQVP
jgi:bifunctional UDP-N-acetylglucosamine pyrophosphorylase/glucosamine-1-phosphate N-acetyltransferase